jgi:hypothetical protein
MPFDGNGTFTPLTPDYPAVADTLIDATKVNNILDDMALGLTNAVTRDGQSPMTANLPMGTKRAVNMGDAVGDQDAVTLTQIRDNFTFHGLTSDDGITVSGGVADLSGAASLSVPAASTGVTATVGDDSTKLATTAFVQDAAFTAALPSQAGQPANAVVKTDGAGNAAWSALKTIKGSSLFGAGDLNPQAIAYEARAVNTIFAAADLGKFIEYTGSFTQTYGTAAALGANWWIVVKNNFTDSVYHTPAGGATIDGVADFLQYPGEARLIQCDGTNFHSTILHPFSLTFTASGFFFKPPGYKAFEGELWGAGGSGVRNNALTYKSGGGGGGCAKFTIQASALGTSETITIGAGGAAKAVDGDGNVGGNSTLGSLVTAYGGAGGKADNSASTAESQGGSAFIDSSGNVAISSVSGVANSYLAGGKGSSNSAGKSVYGGGGGDGFNTNTPGTAGISVFGGAGGVSSAAGAATAGTAPGGGGGATLTGTSGAGARGELQIWGIV